MTEPTRKQLDAIWTRVVIDPIADRLAPPLARVGWITPNRVTVAAGGLAVAAMVAYGAGALVAGALLFQLRFLVDCLDGRLARLTGRTSARGGALDLLVDTTGVLGGFAVLSTYVVIAGAAGPALIAAVVGGCGMYCWTLAYRKSLPGGGQHDWAATVGTEAAGPDGADGVDRRAGMTGEHGADGRRPAGVHRRYVAMMARRGMVPAPYAVELEALCLTIVPLVAGLLVVPDRAASLVAVGLWCAVVFYAMASALNVVRIWRLAGAIDAAAEPAGGSVPKGSRKGSPE